MEQGLCSVVLSSLEKQIGRVDHLLTKVAESELDWAPSMPNGLSLGVLLGHLLECLAGFCAVLHAANPERLAHFMELRKIPVNHRSGPDEVRRRLSVYRDHIREGVSLLQDTDLGRLIPTVFVPAGEPLLALLLTNCEHLASHKYQLFIYLRMLGLAVGSRDLYHFSGT